MKPAEKIKHLIDNYDIFTREQDLAILREVYAELTARTQSKVEGKFVKSDMGGFYKAGAKVVISPL